MGAVFFSKKAIKAIGLLVYSISTMLLFISCSQIADSEFPAVLQEITSWNLIASNDISCPYLITQVSIETEENPEIYLTGAVKITVANCSDLEISSFLVECRLYRKSDGKNPFIGTNKISGCYYGNLISGSKDDFYLSLDSKIATALVDDLVVDQLFISEISFKDGSIWRDSNGVYAIWR